MKKKERAISEVIDEILQCFIEKKERDLDSYKKLISNIGLLSTQNTFHAFDSAARSLLSDVVILHRNPKKIAVEQSILREILFIKRRCIPYKKNLNNTFDKKLLEQIEKSIKKVTGVFMQTNEEQAEEQSIFIPEVTALFELVVQIGYQLEDIADSHRNEWRKDHSDRIFLTYRDLWDSFYGDIATLFIAIIAFHRHSQNEAFERNVLNALFEVQEVFENIISSYMTKIEKLL